MSYTVVTKDTFLNQLRALPAKIVAQVMDRVRMLEHDPSPHEPAKKKLNGTKGDLYRLRCGDYRVIYTYANGIVTLAGVDDRKDVYKNGLLDVDLPSFSVADIPDVADLLAPTSQKAPQPHPLAAKPDPLPRPITKELLEQLRIPATYQTVLLACKTVDDLCAVEVPEIVRSAVFDTVTTPDYEQVLAQQPDYIVANVDDLLRYKEGELMGFLLRLSPAQEKYVTWGIGAAGPTLVKGGPGTGKSTVALYRVRELLRALRAAGTERPHILFTTYTNALVTYSRQLLQTLLGDDVDCVDVRNYDKLVYSIYRQRHGDVKFASDYEQRQALARAVETVEFSGNPLQKQAQQATIDRLGEAYLLEELNTIITARQLDSLEAYQVTPRSGRRVALNATQRTAVWAVYERYITALAAIGKPTLQQMRAEAEAIVRAGEWDSRYNAVVVDEAQDLDPSVLRMLVGLCNELNRFFLTADANQSIYGSGFSWGDVHEELKFKGRTGVLRTNFRSTREIGQAAQSYLAGGELDTEDTTQPEYVHQGPQPVARTIATGAAECDLLAHFLPAAVRMFQLGRGACAVLVPTAEAGKALAAELTSRGITATFMPSGDLDLLSRNVKVLTLKSAKGLEFPVVALAGFLNAPYPKRVQAMSDDEWAELLAKERRTMYVGMTRAMRALLISVPAGATSPLLTGFSSTYWNCGPAGTTEK